MLDKVGERQGAHAIASVLFLIFASALIWVGVAFAGYAIYVAFLPAVREPWAAVFAGTILIIGPLGWAMVVKLREPRPILHQPESISHVEPENATVTLLAKVAQEKPLVALVCAGILGASEAILRRKE